MLRLTATTKLNGVPYSLGLHFVAAMNDGNRYLLRIEATWVDLPSTHHDYYRKTFESWVAYWTSDFTPSFPPSENEASESLYRDLCEVALQAESHLDSVSAIQEAIIARMKDGERFSTSHKEGGTHLAWRSGRFVRSDCGENPAETTYESEPEFLESLRRFYDSETSDSMGSGKVAELDAWRLILRFLRP